MNDPDRAGDTRPDAPSTDDEAKLGLRLGALGERLAAKSGSLAAKRGSAETAGGGPVSAAFETRQLGQAYRLATDILAGALVGLALGWLIDGWLGTSPWGLIVFLTLGFTAGVLNALRAAGLVQESGARLRANGGRQDTPDKSDA